VRWRATVIGTLLLGPLAFAGPAGAAATCGQPYLPFSAARTIEPPVTGPSLDRLQRVREGAPDTDGDGRPDTVTVLHSDDLDEWRLELRRGDGVVTFAEPVPPGRDAPDLPSGAFVFNRPSAWWGDVDGDGRDDLLVAQIVRPPGDADQQITLWLVPGTVTPGVHRPADVGQLVGGQDADQVGDQDGDGGVDLWVPDQGAVLSGRALLAGQERVLRRLPGPLVGVLELGGPPTIVAEPTAPPDVLDLTLLGSPDVRLRSAGVPFPTGDSTGLRVSALRGADGHRYVWASNLTRGGGASWTWDLDAPCRPTRRVHVVQRGEWLWRIARVELGPATDARVHRYADVVYRANRAAIGPDPDVLRPGLVLQLPPPTG
jgi:hypothetical protein